MPQHISAPPKTRIGIMGLWLHLINNVHEYIECSRCHQQKILLSALHECCPHPIFGHRDDCHPLPWLTANDQPSEPRDEQVASSCCHPNTKCMTFRVDCHLNNASHEQTQLCSTVISTFMNYSNSISFMNKNKNKTKHMFINLTQSIIFKFALGQDR